ncbi:DNA adenine methylase [Persephonella sp.]
MFSTAVKPKPFVKWAGGKRQIAHILIENMPTHYNKYIEPFIGGGALFFELLPEKAIINDINKELINAYIVIKNSPEELIKSLKKHKNEKEYYYKIRALDPEKLNPIERASRFIFLNKTCFNGLYRENSKGQFNVPFGRYKKPKILDEENIKAVSNFLNSIELQIFNTDYREVIKLAKRGDLVYLDPPYHPSSQTANFTKYTKYDFSEKDQIELAENFKQLDKKGCYVILTNSDTPLIRELYRNYNITPIITNRAINSKAHRRKNAATELVIKNY